MWAIKITDKKILSKVVKLRSLKAFQCYYFEEKSILVRSNAYASELLLTFSVVHFTVFSVWIWVGKIVENKN